MLFLTFCFMLNIMAQKRTDLDALSIDELNIYKTNATNLRGGGILLTAVGTGVIVLTLSFTRSDSAGSSLPDELDRFGKRVFFSALGVVSIGIGAPMWLIGSNRKAAAEVALMKYNVKTDNSMAMGIGFTLRF
jgi:hypothetical protein